MSGLLIVNADDWGASLTVTERIAECYAAGAVTSTTAMVHMRDSERAAERALALALPTGLHLNLTQPFDGAAVPAVVREAQRRMAARFAPPLRRDRWIADPRIAPLARRCIEDQLERFRVLYGGDPTHLDGHHHVHLNPVVMSALPRTLRVRTAQREPHVRSALDVARLARHRIIHARHGSTDFFFAAAGLHPRLGGSGIERHLLLAREHSLELMTHPGFDDEHELLPSRDWLSLLAGLRVGSYADLS
jgi:predicted glycoside hydrolase/deacetylase ChbG (UPF0249 family)